jgi:nucleotide-binding universal stress UspA family protein
MSPETAPLNILVGYDGSEHSHAALALLCDLCARDDAAPISHVQLLAVFTPFMAGDQGPLRESLARADNFLKERCFDVSSEFVLGYPAEQLMLFAESQHPDLIIIGARGLRSALGILLGGVAQHVVEYATCPVLAVRAPYHGLKRILLVTDGSESSNKATEYLASFPIPRDASIDVLHVLPPLPLTPSTEFYARTYPLAPEVLPVYPKEPTQEELAWQAEEEKHGHKVIDQAVKLLCSTGNEANAVLLRGDAAKEIIEYAKEHDISLIVSGSRGLSQFKGWLLGSVSRKLVHYSNCSVLTVKSASS